MCALVKRLGMHRTGRSIVRMKNKLMIAMMDFFGARLLTKNLGHNFVLSVMDDFTKYVKLIPVKIKQPKELLWAIFKS